MIGATYRLQFRGGVDFRAAAALAPHLAALGVTHLYASPIFAAEPGSTHGYDVTDHNAFDPTLGTRANFAAMVGALKAHGLALMLDIVPNHMSASPNNPCWRDVLQHGQASEFARHFDIDWSRKLVLPVLGKPYGAALEAGEITRGSHPEWGPVLQTPNPYPLAPGTEAIDDVHACHEAQHYRLAHWRIGRDGLTYRRFFEITGLVGVRVEDETVFADVHRLLSDLVTSGDVAAVRVDHVDGLADPAQTLGALHKALQVPIVVEKILEPGEALPPWPVDGTTGYETIAAFASLYCQPAGIDALSAAYSVIANDDASAMAKAAKQTLLNKNLSGELLRLTALAQAAFADDLSARDHGPFTIREGLSALLCAMPVYRTYVGADGCVCEEDRSVLAAAVDAAMTEPLDVPTIVTDLASLILEPASRGPAQEFVSRFQQLSGPLMAKAVEDTLFFRHHRFVGLNEVGGTHKPAFGSAPFLRMAGEGGLAATQTHDTKRGEDARARLYALTDPHFARVFAELWRRLPGNVPDRLKWCLGQMLFAHAPLSAEPDFADRLAAAALKAVREAKEETSWTAQNAAFERQVTDAAHAMAEAIDTLEPLADAWRVGAIIGLGQALLKCMGKRAPDIYQGTLGWDFAMVDPDNRRPIDFDREAAQRARASSADLETLTRDWRTGDIKARVLCEALALRKSTPELFRAGRLSQCSVDSPAPFFAVMCEDRGSVAIAVVPLQPRALLGESGLTLPPHAPLRLQLPAPVTERFTGVRYENGPQDLAPHFSRFPVFLGAL